MRINVLMIGGSCRGRLVRVQINRFKIGMQIKHDGGYYTVQDGPAAKAFEMSQEECDHLAVRAVFEGIHPAK